MHLKLRHLEVFHAVMEEGSVTKAAERLNLSQPAISTALTRLEEMLGCALFYRSKGHFTPRPEAFLLNKDAELALMAAEQFANRGRLIGRGGIGLVRIGAIGAPAFALLPELISAFVTDHPLVEVDLQVRSSTQISYLVANGQLDIGLIEAPVAAASIAATEIALPCVCIIRENSELAAKHIITPQDLTGQRLIGIQKGNQVDRQLRAVCSGAGVEIETTVQGFFFAVVRRMISAGGGVALVDALNGMQALNDGVVWRRFEPRIDYRVAMITKVGAELSKPARDFSDRLNGSLETYGPV